MDPVTPVFKINKTVAGNTTRMAGRILDLDIDPSPLFHCTYPPILAAEMVRADSGLSAPRM
jgi:hypothetical protein